MWIFFGRFPDESDQT